MQESGLQRHQTALHYEPKLFRRDKLWAKVESWGVDTQRWWCRCATVLVYCFSNLRGTSKFILYITPIKKIPFVKSASLVYPTLHTSNFGAVLVVLGLFCCYGVKLCDMARSQLLHFQRNHDDSKCHACIGDREW